MKKKTEHSPEENENNLYLPRADSRGRLSLRVRAFYGLRKLARALMNRQVQIGEDSDGFTLAFRDVLAYKRLYEVAFFKTAYGISGVDLDELAEKLEKRDEADKDAIPDMSKRVRETQAEETAKTKYNLSYQSVRENAELLSLVDKVEEGSYLQEEKVYFGIVSDWNAKKIKTLTGIDVKGFRIAIEARQVSHILKRHGKNGIQDQSMGNPSDIAQMEYALENPDDISNAGKTKAYTYMKNGKNKTADTVLYEKIIGEKSYYVVQAVPDTRAKTLYIVSAFIGQKGYKKEAPQLITAIRPDATSEVGSVDASTYTVSQTTPVVKTFDGKNDTDTDGDAAVSSKAKHSLPAEGGQSVASDKEPVPTGEGGQRTKKDLSPEDAKARDEFLREVDRIERKQAAFMNDEQKKASGDVLEFLAERGITGKGTEAHGSIAVAAEEPKEEQTETPARKPGRLKAYTKKEIKEGLAGALIDVLTRKGEWLGYCDFHHKCR